MNPQSGGNGDSSQPSPQQLPTPCLSPLHGSPVLNPFALKDEIIHESQNERLEEVAFDEAREYGDRLHLDGLSSGIVDLTSEDLHVARPSVLSTNGDRKVPSNGQAATILKPTNSTNKSILKASPAQIHEATTPLSSSFQPAISNSGDQGPLSAPLAYRKGEKPAKSVEKSHESEDHLRGRPTANGTHLNDTFDKQQEGFAKTSQMGNSVNGSRPNPPTRTVSTPPLLGRKKSSSRVQDGRSRGNRGPPALLNIKDLKQSSASISANLKASTPVGDRTHSPMPVALPIPPLSIPTYLQLELAADRPSSAYIHRSANADFPYESSAVIFERLRNFLLLPPQLEHILWFGTIACIDTWLYTFTILPLRFLIALWMLFQWWMTNAWKEACHLVEFVYLGIGRLWRRRRRTEIATASGAPSREVSQSRRASLSGRRKEEPKGVIHAWPEPPKKHRKNSHQPRSKRTRSTPSLLQPSHKADLLKGSLVIISSVILLQLDPSRMYHNIRGQAAIKLYVIYNVLEVGDRLLSAIGQDVLECLFSREVLERRPDGRSKIMRPLWVFLVALAYNVIHTAALLYQVISLNVAVNSYSNALLTLLMSNQFVEIKGAVFKKVEKDNLFQLTCADVVERFQLWLMLLIIAMRNMVEVGGLGISLSSSFESASATVGANATGIPIITRGLLPQAFTILPKFTGQVLGPSVVVLGSEMLVDWLKHAYINKFNNQKPAIYGRYLDVMAKDYYTHAFADQNLTKRIGLPVLPLACLFIRASIQTYHMFLATHMPLPIPSVVSSLSAESASASSTAATTAALAHIDQIIRRALGRASFPDASGNAGPRLSYTLDDGIAFAFLLVICLAGFLVMLAVKLLLGMVMLRWARSRYRGMKERERTSVDAGTRRLGINGVVGVDDEAVGVIYDGDAEGLARFREREEKNRRERERGRIMDLGGVMRYSMVAKRIW